MDAAPDPGHPTAPAIPPAAGVGLRHPHVPDFLAGRLRAAWLEVHSETWLAPGGPRLRALEAIRRDHPLSCHGVGLSLGSAEGLDPGHLARLRAFYDRIEPGLVSDHLSWSVQDGAYLNDLLPLPGTEEALEAVCRNVADAQDALARRLLVENPSHYLRIAESTVPEPEFLAEMARRTGCGLLLDLNNVVVSAANLGFSAQAYLDAFPAAAVSEIHVAGHLRHDGPGGMLLIDDHGDAVGEAVWSLLAAFVRRHGPRPVLVEWDTRVPGAGVLLDQAARADRVLAAEACHAA